MFWDQVATDASTLRANVWSDLDLEECLAAITTGLDISGRIIDLGCGPGRLTKPLAARNPQAHLLGVDSSRPMIELAMTNGEPNISWHHNNGRDLADLDDDCCDGGYSMTVFQHIPHPAQLGYLRELNRVMRSEGRFRFQFVTESDQGPLNHPTSIPDMLDFAELAGWQPAAIEEGLIYDEWAWMTLING